MQGVRGEGDCLSHALQSRPVLFSLFLVLCPLPLLHPFLITDSTITASDCLLFYFKNKKFLFLVSYYFYTKFIQAKKKKKRVHKCIYHTSTVCIHINVCVDACVFCTIRTFVFLGQQSMLGIIFGSLNRLHYLLLDAQGLLLSPK